VTPDQYLLRARLRRAAVRLLSEKHHIAEIAFEWGFGNLSNFNRAFKQEFRVTRAGIGARAASEAPRTDSGSCRYRDRLLIVPGGKLNPRPPTGLPPQHHRRLDAAGPHHAFLIQR
jgi:hypothetical protein